MIRQTLARVELLVILEDLLSGHLRLLLLRWSIRKVASLHPFGLWTADWLIVILRIVA